MEGRTDWEGSEYEPMHTRVVLVISSFPHTQVSNQPNRNSTWGDETLLRPLDSIIPASPWTYSIWSSFVCIHHHLHLCLVYVYPYSMPTELLSMFPSQPNFEQCKIWTMSSFTANTLVAANAIKANSNSTHVFQQIKMITLLNNWSDVPLLSFLRHLTFYQHLALPLHSMEDCVLWDATALALMIATGAKTNI